MNKLSAIFKNLLSKWKETSRNKKLAFSIFFIGILVALIYIGIFLGSTNYVVLFSNMDPADSAAVYQKLKDDKVTAKVSGTSILVPKGQVDQLRMQMLSEVTMTNGSTGFELLDKSQLGTTDEEIKINYQRALQGELERTIKSFPQIDGARVHLVIPESTAFVRDTSAGSASVTLKLKTGTKLDSEQVRAIIALISGSVTNIPKENVQVIDDKMTLLSKGIYSGASDSANDLTSTDKQQELKKSFETELEKKAKTMLETIYGKDKVTVNVNADLDFDAVEQASTTYDPKSVVVSEHTVTSGNGTVTSNTSSSPVDNNMTNTTVANSQTGGTVSADITKNYDVSKVEQKTIKAPGSVKRLTTSVAIDGKADDVTKNSVKNLVISAIGFSDLRGDVINVEGIPFDTTIKDSAKKDLDAINTANAKAQKTKMFAYIGAGVATLLVIVVGVLLFMRRRKNKDEEAIAGEIMMPKGLDVILDQNFGEDLHLNVESEKSHMENQIKKYAKEKPEQVADIIKTWLAEDERG